MVLEAVMNDFHHQRFNVLVCTTIIENGLDIPTANTIIMERADKLGLAQMHQLRGRVGRSHHQAYAYLLTPDPKAMTKDAIKRLEAITSLEDLGAGFTLATHDLEIRGAGEFLGEEQSGHMQAIGFNLYMEFLQRAMRTLKSGKTTDIIADLSKHTEVDLSIPALIPNDYIADVHTRLIFYKRIANAKNNETLQELQTEMIDRFGMLAEPIKHLFTITRLKLRAEKLGINKIAIHHEFAYFEFDKNPNVEPMLLIKLIQQYPQKYKMFKAEKLRITLTHKDIAKRIENIDNTLNQLSGEN
ncbi:MAG: transcription-repair coupling factor [Gammaproteobacteria bacterium]|nr:transcription-repair coupling factor [Gammaproteobacteria bacterium]